MSGDIVTAAQLRAGGQTKRQIAAAVAAGELCRIARGVYATRRPRGTLLLRGLLIAHPGLTFTAQTAAQLYLGREATAPAHGLVAKGSATRDDQWLRSRQTRVASRRWVGEFPVAAPLQAARDLMDKDYALARTLLERLYRGKDGERRLREEFAAMTRPGVRLRSLVEHAAVGADSELERTLFRELRRRGVRVRQNVAVAGYRFDGLVGEHILVEVDSYRYHSASVLGGAETAESFVRDRFKANVAQHLGYLVLRYSDADIDFHLADAVDRVEAIVRDRPPGKLISQDRLTGRERRPVWEWHHGILQYRGR